MLNGPAYTFMGRTGNRPGRRRTSVREAIKQTAPFQSAAQEALIALLLTAEAVRWPFRDLLARRSGLTLQQYNVLRILRGAGKGGLPTLEIADRMFERTPGISRMIDRLERKGLVDRERAAEDLRRMVCHASSAALALLRRLDRPVDELDVKVMSALTKAEQRELLRLLNKLRNGLPEPS